MYNFHSNLKTAFLRTKFDNALNNKWNCKREQNTQEKYAPLTGFRTDYDLMMKKKWDTGCK